MSQGHGVELCARLHYPADLVMTAGAQEEGSRVGDRITQAADK